MVASKMHRIVLRSSNFEILSADTGFYEYVGDDRLYFTFNRLICERDVEVFLNHVQNGYAEYFVLHMVGRDGNLIPCYVSIVPGEIEGRFEINLINIDKLFLSEREFHMQNMINERLLELFGDDMFIYDPIKDDIKLILREDGLFNEKIMSLDAFADVLKKGLVEEEYKEIGQFTNVLRNRSRFFSIVINGKTIYEDDNVECTVIKGGYVYEEGEEVVAVGYIHKGIKRKAGVRKKEKYDALTGVFTKDKITEVAIKAIDINKQEGISIAIIDVDYFKKVNDTFGHMMGDTVLKKVAHLIKEEVGNSGIVGRIGGDEFFVIFNNVYDMEECREKLRSIKCTVGTMYPPNVPKRPAVTLSIGCAAYPKDADNYNDLFELADFALYRAKEKGRNRYIIYDKEKHGTLADIRKTTTVVTRINSRGDMTHGDIMCVILDKAYKRYCVPYSMHQLLDDIIENFAPQRITIYDAVKGEVVYMNGEHIPDEQTIRETEKYIHCTWWQKKYESDVVMIDNIARLQGEADDVYEYMKKQGILSCIHLIFYDKKDRKYILSLESVSTRVTWNEFNMHLYRLMAKVLSDYDIEEEAHGG